ncbi:cation:proton antiporter [uncultured Sulfitobacter sp.]|uniref:cation:proton antiporter n=1 Tax=uncultured Sulfitobacter sp. TaxID=191468 RepID=UPI0026188567|nr:cation:proton antiporter [uncultured Sulfitobacter sp.]
MEQEPFFELSSYHLILAIVGTIIILSRWIPRLISSRDPAAASLMILFGAAAVLIFPDIPAPPDPRDSPKLWEVVAEVTVIVALFGAGMRVDSIGPLRKWAPTLRLLIIAMPLTILAITLLGVTIGGLTVAGAVLLAAVLAPTDPVLAEEVQIAPPQEGEEHPVRFALTTEAALNDGLAFPFVYLGLIIAVQGLAVYDWGLQWLLRDVIYRIGVGALMGWAGGWLLGQVLFNLPRESRLADTGSGVIAIAGVFLCYGTTELVEGYGFIAVAVLGLSLRRIESDHGYHRHLHDFSESIEHVLTAILLTALGTALPILMMDLTWQHVVMSAIVLLVVRPVAGWVSLTGTGLQRPDRAVIAVYGVRGIGSIYYLAYAATYVELSNISDLWLIMAFTILASTILHGFTVGRAMDWINR